MISAMRSRVGCALCCAAVMLSTMPAPAERPADERVIIAYVFPRGRVLVPGEIDAARLTHINYAFANVVNGEVAEGSPQDAANFAALAELRRTHPRLKVLVSVGGWKWSKGFSDAALTVESRRRFVDSAIAFVRRHVLDGVDIDWEYPAMPGDSNPYRPDDTSNFTTLMGSLRAGLDAEAKPAGRTLLLTMAAGAFPAFLAHTEMDAVQRSVDFVNLMKYDFRVESVDHTNPDTTRTCAPTGRRQTALGRTLGTGISVQRACRRKIVVGVPFYGRAWRRSRQNATASISPGKRSRRRSTRRRAASTRCWPPGTGGCAAGTSVHRHRTCGTASVMCLRASKTKNRCASRRATSASRTWPA